MLAINIVGLSLLTFANSLENELPEVNTSLGTVRGHYKLSYENRTFAAFEGIPYAKPPIGDLRFAEPVEADSWPGIWNATTTHTCMQLMWLQKKVIGDEDCLYLNVYIPKDKLNENENMDVLMHIHGGAFMVGSPSRAGPGYLMDRNIVYVSINYRLGPLGFLSTEDDVVPGNNGLKDQVQALKWIQNNIKHFGGNPKSVTITGMSAGGAAVHLHYFSSLSRGLFHGGIAQSGTALAPWAIQGAPLKQAKKLAATVGCVQPETKEFINCMKQRSGKRIFENLKYFDEFSGFPLTPFAPVIEKTSQTAFLVDYPYKLLKNNENIYDVPLSFTITTEEGILGFYTVHNSLNELNEEWNEVLPHILDYSYTVDAADKITVAKKIKEFYFNEKPVSKENIPSFIKLFGDRHFKLDCELASRMHVKIAKSPIFSYTYGYRRNHSYGALFGLNESYGVGHGDDGNLLYTGRLHTISFSEDKLSENDEKIKDLLVDFVTSFAKNGRPEIKNINWKPVTDSENFDYLFIHEADDIKMISKEEVAPTEFWHSLPINEYDKFIGK